jgi:hypothetical protein
MKVTHAIVLVVLMLVMVGCSSGLQVIQRPNASDRLAIVLFADCNGAIDCPGSGKKVTDIYSEVLGAPVVMFESDAKGYDILLTGNVLRYNEAVPMAGHANLVKVNLQLKRIADNSVLISQIKQAAGSNLFSSTKSISRSLAEKLKESM